MDNIKETSKGIGTSLKQCALLVLVATLLGFALNSSLVINSFNGQLTAEIQKRQLNELKSKAAKLSSDIRFIDLISAKKLFDEQQAVFWDARSAEEYQESTIKGALGISLMSVVKKEIEQLLPNREATIVTFCSGGECDVGVEMAKELVDRGYENIFVMGEGYPGWKDAGYPVFKSNQEVY